MTVEIPLVPMQFCEWHKSRNCLKLASEFCGMPSKIRVQSQYTGRIVEFQPVKPGDELFDEDQWDGEQQIYRPVEPLKNVEYLVIYHAW